MKTIETTVYEYAELSDKAKAAARDWYRENGFDYEWYDFVFEDAKEIGLLIGIEIASINFSGFGSQGDGARFKGVYHAPENSVEGACLPAVKSHAPADERLHTIAAAFDVLQKDYEYELTANIEYRYGNYEHSGMTNITIYIAGKEAETDEQTRNMKDNLRAFMDWIYTQLKKTWDDINSDKSVAETIEANEYTFTEDGKRFG